MLLALNINLITGTHYLLVVKTCFILVSLFSFSVRTSRYVVLCNEIKTFLWFMVTIIASDLPACLPKFQLTSHLALLQAKMVSLNMPLKHCCVQVNCPQLHARLAWKNVDHHETKFFSLHDLQLFLLDHEVKVWSDYWTLSSPFENFCMVTQDQNFFYFTFLP